MSDVRQLFGNFRRGPFYGGEDPNAVPQEYLNSDPTLYQVGDASDDEMGLAWRRFVEAGIYNGDFGLPSPTVNSPIDNDANKLPHWTFGQSVGTSITARVEADAAVASGYVVEFDLGAGNAGDAAYIEQIIPVPSDAGQGFATGAEVVFHRGPSAATATLTVSTEYLEEDEASTGISSSGSVGIGNVDNGVFRASAMRNAPATASKVRIRVTLTRSNTDANTGSVRVYAVRALRAQTRIHLPDGIGSDSYGSLTIADLTGTPYLRIARHHDPFGTNKTAEIQLEADDTPRIGFDMNDTDGIYEFEAAQRIVKMALNLVGTAPGIVIGRSDFNSPILTDITDSDAPILGVDEALDLPEIAAPDTPSAGRVRFYAKTDGRFYSKDDTGTETALGGVTDHGALAGLGDDDHPQYALDADLTGHTGDTSDAHDASAISVADAGGYFASTDVEAALQEVGPLVFVGCKAQRTATQSIATATDTDLLFTAADDWDTDGFHDPAVNSDRVTIPAGKGGKYVITANCEFAVNGTGQRKLTITVNGVALEGGDNAEAAPNLNHRCNATVEAQLAAGDIVRASVRQNSGGNLNIEKASLSVRRFAS